jgi:hypothetical protein
MQSRTVPLARARHRKGTQPIQNFHAPSAVAVQPPRRRTHSRPRRSALAAYGSNTSAWPSLPKRNAASWPPPPVGPLTLTPLHLTDTGSFVLLTLVVQLNVPQERKNFEFGREMHRSVGLLILARLARRGRAPRVHRQNAYATFPLAWEEKS